MFKLPPARDSPHSHSLTFTRCSSTCISSHFLVCTFFILFGSFLKIFSICLLSGNWFSPLCGGIFLSSHNVVTFFLQSFSKGLSLSNQMNSLTYYLCTSMDMNFSLILGVFAYLLCNLQWQFCCPLFHHGDLCCLFSHHRKHKVLCSLIFSLCRCQIN